MQIQVLYWDSCDPNLHKANRHCDIVIPNPRGFFFLQKTVGYVPVPLVI